MSLWVSGHAPLVNWSSHQHIYMLCDTLRSNGIARLHGHLKSAICSIPTLYCHGARCADRHIQEQALRFTNAINTSVCCCVTCQNVAFKGICGFVQRLSLQQFWRLEPIAAPA